MENSSAQDWRQDTELAGRVVTAWRSSNPPDVKGGTVRTVNHARVWIVISLVVFGLVSILATRGEYIMPGLVLVMLAGAFALYMLVSGRGFHDEDVVLNRWFHDEVTAEDLEKLVSCSEAFRRYLHDDVGRSGKALTYTRLAQLTEKYQYECARGEKARSLQTSLKLQDKG